MIVSASYRTDIPAYYGDWFARRLDAGYCLVRNPYGGRPSRVALDRDSVDGFVFWTRNPAPFRPILDRLRAEKRPFVVQFTVTGYPRVLEPGVIDADAAIFQARQLAAAFGPRALVWRYDPVVLSEVTPLAFHRAGFARLAAALAGCGDEVVISFAEPYAKARRNMKKAGRNMKGARAGAESGGFTWDAAPALEIRRALTQELAEIAAAHGFRLSLCTQPALLADLGEGGVTAARCIDAARLSDIADRPVRAATKGNRPGCACAESRDIGAYDSCAQGCAYCYAVRDRDRAKARLKAHDPAGEYLISPEKPAAGG